MAVKIPFFRYLDTVGNGTGTKVAAVDGSGTPQIFKIERTDPVYLERMIVHIEDAGALAGGNYGAIAGPLANGVEIGIYNRSNDALVQDLLDGLPIKSNAQWARVCFDVSNITFASGNNYVNVRWTFAKSGQALWIPAEFYLGAVINDDLTGLVDHTFMVQGFTSE